MKQTDYQLITDLEQAFKERGYVRTSKDFAELIGENANGLSDIKAGRKKLALDHLRNVKKSHPNFNVEYVLSGEGGMFLDASIGKSDAEYIAKIEETLKTMSVMESVIEYQEDKISKQKGKIAELEKDNAILKEKNFALQKQLENIENAKKAEKPQ